MEIFSKQDHLFLSDTYALAEQISAFGIYASCFLLTASGILTIFFVLFAKDTLKFACRYTDILTGLIVAGTVYTALILLMMTWNYLISRFKIFKRASTTDKTKLVLTKILSFLYFGLEFLIYEIKSIIIVLLLSSSHLQSKLEQQYSGQAYTALLATVISDFIATIGLCYFKTQFLRQEVPDGSYFARIPGKFETVYIVAMPLITFGSLWSNKFSFSDLDNYDAMFLTSQAGISASFYIALLVVALVLLLVYLSELPYYNTLCERYVCHTLCTTLSTIAAIGISNYSYRLVAILLCLILPLQAVFVEMYIDYVYDDKIDVSDKKVSHTRIKVILAGNEAGRSRESLKNVFIKRVLGKEDKFVTEEAQIMEKVMGERERTIVDLLKKNCIETKDFESEESILVSRDNGQKSKSRYFHRFDIKDDIYFQMISRYVEQSSYDQSACLVKLEWMLKKKFVILEILSLLNRILLNQETFRSKYICFYALKLTEKKLKFFYKMKESADSGYKDLNKVGLDLDTVLEYKKYMQKLISSVESFSTLSKRVMQLIMTDGSSLRDIYSYESKLFRMNQTIDQDFKVFHDNTLKTEYYHLIPYFYHLMYNVNLYRSSKRIYQTFLARLGDATKQYIDSNDVKLDNLSVMLCSTTFLCDSDQSCLSLIKNVYGNKSERYQSCIDKYPDVILPKVQNQFHYQAMRNYMKSDNTTQIKNINVGFTKMPNDNLIVKSMITIKVVPRLKQNFNFMVNLMERQNAEDYYVLVSQNLEIDSYSKNLAKIVERKYLVPGVPIGTVSKKAEEFIRVVLAECKQTDQKGNQSDKLGLNKATSDFKRSFTSYSALSNFEDQNIANKMLHEMAQKKLDYAEELTFGAARKSTPKLFYVNIVFNSFKYIAGGYFLLRMRDANSLKLGDVKRRVPRKIVRRNNDNFILNFSHTTSNAADGKAIRDSNFDESGCLDDDGEVQGFNNWQGGDIGNINQSVGPYDVPASNDVHDLIIKVPLRSATEDAREIGDPEKSPMNGLQTSRPLSIGNTLNHKDTQMSQKTLNTRFDKKLESLEKNYEQQLKLSNRTNTENLKNIEKDIDAIKKNIYPKVGRIVQNERLQISNTNSEINSIEVNPSADSLNDKKAAIARVKEEKIMTRSSMVTVDASMGYKHNKIVYEDICTRKSAPSEIKLNRLHFVASLLFVTAFLVAILMFSFSLNSTFTSLNDFYLSYYDYKFSIQRITNKVLYQHGLDTGKIAEDRYAFLDFEPIANFSKYNKDSLKIYMTEFELKFRNLVQVTVNSQQSVSNVLFDQSISVSRNFLHQAILNRSQSRTPEVITVPFSVFEGLIVESYSRISRIVWSMNTSTLLPFYLDSKANVISKGLNFIGQYFLLYDSLNQHPLSKIEDILTNELLRSQNSTLIVLLVVLLCALVLNFVLACIQFLIVRNLTKKIFRVFITFHLISDPHLKKRLDQLESIYLLMRDIREGNYTIHDSYRRENFEMLTKKLKKDYAPQKSDRKIESQTNKMLKMMDNSNHSEFVSRGRRIKYSKDSYFFNLFESYLAIALQAVLIIGYMVLIYLQFSEKIDKKSVLFTKEQQLNQLGNDAITLHNYILADYFFESPNLLLQKQTASQGIQELYNSVAENWFNKIDSIFGIDDGLGKDSFVHNFRNQSSCQLIDQFKLLVSGSKTYCDLGQLTVMNQSLYASLVSMYRQFLDLYKLTTGSRSPLERSSEFNELRNKEWEFYLGVLFYPTVDALISMVKQSFLKTYNNTDADSLQLVVLYSLAFIALYYLCSTLAFNNLRRQIDVIRFAFQTFSMKAVLDNNKIKARFVDFFGVNSREFI